MDSGNHFEVRMFRSGGHGNCLASIVFTLRNSHAVVSRPPDVESFVTPDMGLNLAAWILVIAKQVDPQARQKFWVLVKEIEGR